MKLIRGFSYYDFFIRSAEVLVYGDVRIQFYNDKKLAFHCWFNTYFVDRSGVFYINKVNIDNDTSCNSRWPFGEPVALASIGRAGFANE